MIEIRTIEVAGFASAFQALRLPFKKECRSISHTKMDYNYAEIATTSSVFIDPKDLTLMSTLVKRGDEHSKTVRGIMVYAEINAPRYWWQEMDTYRVGTDRLSSESTMHCEGRGMSEEELVEMKNNLPEGTMQKRVQVFSYQTLRRIYIQRRKHRLPHWRKFCEWVEALPYADELILIGLNNLHEQTH